MPSKDRRKVLTEQEPWYSLCVECGPNVSLDQDGCCGACGGTAIGSWLETRLKARDCAVAKGLSKALTGVGEQ